MRSDGPGFWTFFFAVLAALLVHDLIRVVIVSLGLSVAFAGFGYPVKQTSVAPQAVQAAPLPAWPNAQDAIHAGASRACINGMVADRINGGWQQHPDQRCVER